MRNLIISAVFAAASLFGMTAQAAEAPAAPYVELSNPVPVAVPGKIEVVELFWYGCPHCYAFEPVINPWVEKLPTDVNFVRIPAMFGGAWDAHGQMFLTLEAMGVEHNVHAAVFNAIQKEHKKLIDKEARKYRISVKDVKDGDWQRIASDYGPQVFGLPIGEVGVEIAGQTENVVIEAGQVTEF